MVEAFAEIRNRGLRRIFGLEDRVFSVLYLYLSNSDLLGAQAHWFLPLIFIMFPKHALVALSLIVTALGQQVGTQQAENHPQLQWSQCTSGGCTVQGSSSVVLDSNWRWLHTTSGYTNCYTGNTWDTSLCPDGQTCAQNCALDGADYPGTYGITSSGNALTLKFVTQGQQKNIGSRVYLMADETHYQMFKLLNKEFTFDVDLSALPCGLNGALYFSEMDADGGMSKYSTNRAGAKYGTGYCDSQCPRDIKFINGEVSYRPVSFLKQILIDPFIRRTLLAGRLLRTTLTREPVVTVPAAVNSTFGKPTPSPLPTPLIHARSLVRLAAKALTAPSTVAMKVSVTPMVATSIPTVWVSRTSTGRA